MPYTYGARQLISNEVEKEKMRRSDTRRGIVAGATEHQPNPATTAPPASSTVAAV